MNKLITIFLALFAGLSLLTGCGEKIQQSSTQTQSADFPMYDAEALINGKTDLVAVVDVVNTEEVKDGAIDPEGTHQEAILQVRNKIYGDESRPQIKLYQSVDRVQKNKTYLLFLSYRSTVDQYVVSDGRSQIEVKDKKVKVDIEGIEGEYTLDEFDTVFKEKVKKVKNTK
ncbi:MAG TPA: hypothetical protein VMS09_05180 [Paenibacillus sp.]|uniref:hypothetical protein n=1 Tax=Paenibacillus sp. TaxID=58172 RepID=UPI0028D0F419|nr:hypothetical protein [Paenibacillus sp.]HUC91411.1 hypothetical protein [Paenibacillus sp.]